MNVKLSVYSAIRFGSSSKLCSYAGLVPSTHASGEKEWYGRLTKQGSKWLRWSVIEAVTPAICSNGELRSYYESKPGVSP
ncbi:MAG: IS110 family transposase [Spirochaetota bacterium]|nr:MAG: IS110 family transposase [Spirochaetota bacterium]